MTLGRDSAARAWNGLLIGLMTLFVLNVGLMIAAVATSSFARRWLGTWLPDGFTTTWYASAWKEFQLDHVLWVTIEVVGAVVLLSILLGVPAAYALARRDFTGKRALLLLFLLSLLVPVRTIAMFELTFLTSGPDSQTLVVALYYAVFAAGVRAPQSVDAMAMIYMAVTLVWLLIALRFVDPTQLVSRVNEARQ